MKRALLGLLLFLPCGCQLVEPPRVDVEAVTQSLNSAVESLTSVEASLRDERSKLLARYDADRRCFEQLLAKAQEKDGGVLFEFGNGDELFLFGTQLKALDKDSFTFF